MRLVPLDSNNLDHVGRGYPRPLLRREHWYSLNGEWEFAIDADGAWQVPAEVKWRDRIQVPFSPETLASGIADSGLYRAVWYRRQFEIPRTDPNERLFLRFGAVDYAAKVWVNGTWVGNHRGGYTPFSFDITSLIDPSSGRCEIIVCADDDPQDLAKPRGKQDWQLEPHSIWYPRTTGIWQTVWIERVPRTALSRITFTPQLARWEIGVGAWMDGEPRERLRLSATLSSRGTLLAADTYTVVSGEVHRRVALSDPGIDDSRNELLWSPHAPNLIDVQLDLWGERGELLDRVMSYTALRSSTVQGDRFLLNSRPYHLRMVLDQGYWPEGGLTAPDDAALRRDVELAKSMGFNGVRKHQKIEDPQLSLLGRSAGTRGVGGDAERVSVHGGCRCERLTREWFEVIARDYSHPCVITLGADQRIVGRAEPAGQSDRAALRAGAVLPDSYARFDTAGDRKRRLGKRRDRHHRHPRLRRSGPIASPGGITPKKCCRGCSSGSARAAACSCSRDTRTPISRSC